MNYLCIKEKMKLYLTIITLLFCSITTATPPPTTFYIGDTDGDWTTASTWDINSVPANNQTSNSADITIDATVTLTGNLDIKSGTVLTVNVGDTLIVNGDLILNNGSSLVVNGVLIINGNVTNNNNSNDVTINGEIIIDGNFTGGNGSALVGAGSMSITGSVTTTGGTVFGSEVDCVTDCDNSATQPLPIELIYFNGKQDGSNILIKWSTASEINNDKFILERSIDGYYFETVTMIGGAGNSYMTIDYCYLDTNAVYGVSYYRLTQVDYNGDSETFNTISVYMRHDKNGLTMDVYPIPTEKEDKINVRFLGQHNYNQEINVILMDTRGVIYYSKVVVLSNDGETVYSFDPHNRVSSGTYLIIGSSDNKTYKQKIIIE